jgi:DNA-binding transcriptional MerR regulator
MPARSHHSIGEVLSLLQDDFPDITISKIRFLESQGLISPERTPSGYRRFFERDLERLRWILTQQRDHYLPLKVIREKLASGEPLPDVALAGPHGASGGSASGSGGDEIAPDAASMELAGEPEGSAGGDLGAGPTAEALNGHDPAGQQGETVPSPAPEPAGAPRDTTEADMPAAGTPPEEGLPEMTPVDLSLVEGNSGTTADGDVLALLEAGELIGASEAGEPVGPGAVTGPGDDELVAPPDTSTTSEDRGHESQAQPPAATQAALSDDTHEAGDADGPDVEIPADGPDPLLDGGPSAPDVVDPAPALAEGAEQGSEEGDDGPAEESSSDPEPAQPDSDHKPTARPRQRRSQGSRSGPDVPPPTGTEADPFGANTDADADPGSEVGEVAAAPVEAAAAPATAGTGPIEVAADRSDDVPIEDGPSSGGSISTFGDQSGSHAEPVDAIDGGGASQSGGVEASADRPEPAEPAVRPGSAPQPDQPPAIVALTRDELAELSGCSIPVLSDLERFGLLHGKTVGRGVLYDNDAVVVARLAANFANHGLEPRHLRSFRLAAEREIGLFAQVVGPLLQRRDAMAHDRAMQTLTELADLASELHEVLVRNLVNREFGKG